MSTAGKVLTAPLIGLIVAYQRVVSPMRPQTCRYYPSCSAYAVTALQRFGPVKGTWLALKRLGRCHPWSAGGVDHVPGGPPSQHDPPSPHPSGRTPDLPATRHTHCVAGTTGGTSP